MRSTVALAVLFTLGAAPLVAQDVGYPPSKSPYRDIETPQKLTLFGGYLAAGKDRIGAAPGSASMMGVQYEVTVGGPAQFYARLSRAGSERNAFDPTNATNPSLGKLHDPMWLADVGFSLNLTGQRSWHNLVPTTGFGIGIASARGSTEKDPYTFGTQFAFIGDLGVRYIPSRHYEFRIGLGPTVYQNHYPTAYYTIPTGATTGLVTNGVAKTSYLLSWRLTAGVAVPIFR